MSRSPGDLLIRLCAEATRIVLAAPYMKVGALKKVLSVVDPLAELICITRWSPQDLAVGASDLECRTLIVDHGGMFGIHAALHAKYYRIDDVALVGSANLTFAGMGWTSGPNLEILCEAAGGFEAQSFEQVLLDESREINDKEFSRWQALGAIAAKDRGGGQQDPPTLADWRPLSRDPRHLLLAYREELDEIASDDERRAVVQDVQSMRIPVGLTDHEVGLWASQCLLSTSFANRALKLHRGDVDNPSGRLAEAYDLSVTAARRSMETVSNWLTMFAPEIYP